MGLRLDPGDYSIPETHFPHNTAVRIALMQAGLKMLPVWYNQSTALALFSQGD